LLRRHISAGRVVEFQPRLRPGQTRRRGLYVTKEIERWLLRQTTKAADIQNKQFTIAALKRFVIGETVDNVNYMKRLAYGSEECWEIRLRTCPQVRIFGVFIREDCFLCTNMRLRPELGKFGSPQWGAAKARCTSIWSQLFPGFRPFTATDFTYYVTENGVHYDWPRR